MSYNQQLESAVQVQSHSMGDSLMERFSKQVQARPFEPALIHNDDVLSYASLNTEANRVAHQLQAAGVVKGMLIPLCMEKSLESVIGMIAILKLGCAYVPLDPAWPLKRIGDVLSELDSPVILVRKLGPKYASISMESVSVQYSVLNESQNELVENIHTEVSPEDPMYVLFTSGSTSTPKGVIVPYRGILNRLDWMNEEFGAHTAQAVLQLSKHTFDVSIGQIFWPLTTGGTTIVPPDGMLMNAERIGQLLDKYQIKLISMVPSLMSEVVDDLSRSELVLYSWRGLEYAWIGGEEIVSSVVHHFHQLLANVQVSNHYGPTETSIACLYYKVERHSSETIIPVGKPISNLQVYIINPNGDVLPDGEVGEIAVAGVGLSLGYLRDPEKTDAAFIKIQLNGRTERIYKTGDVGRVQHDGNIMYMGRLDHQIKIRGQRVELSEIESALRSLEGIRQAVVCASTDRLGQTRLIAYYVTACTYDAVALKAALADLLPEIMIPSQFIELSQFPLNANGKIDRKRLPDPSVSMAKDQEVHIPQTIAEKTIAAIWMDILYIDTISTTSSFFDLGGNSLKAMKLAARLEAQFGVSVPITFAFHYDRIQQQATYIEQMPSRPAVPAVVPSVEVRSHYSASSHQKRLFIIQQQEETATTYNVPGALYLEGKLDVEKLQRAAAILVASHAALRTSFALEDGEVIQIIHNHVPFTIEYEEWSEQGLDETIASFIRPFQLSEAPLFRFKLQQIDVNRHLFLYDFHHSIADGISIGILMNECFELYNGNVISPSSVEYYDYSDWQNRLIDSEYMNQQETYWLNQFSEAVPVLQLPTDFSRPPLQSFDGGQVTITLEPDLGQRLFQFCSGQGVTMHMVLLSAFYILLSKYARQDDIVIGTPVSGRSNAAFDKVVGMFVNTLPLRNYPEKSKPFTSFLEEIRQSALDAYDNQDFSLETLLNQLHYTRDLSRNPLFDALFVLQNMDANEIMLISQNRHVREAEKSGLRLQSCDFKHGIAKFDLLLEVVEHKKSLFLNLEYASQLFAKHTAERMLQDYCTILQSVLANPNATIAEISLLQEHDRALVVHTFNQTDAEYERNSTLHEWFERQVEKTPEHIAVSYGAEQLTYRELNERANQLARVLRSKGVGADDLIPIMVERSVEMMIGLYGILKAGGAYVPISPDFPDDRIQYICSDCKAKLVLIQEKGIHKVAGKWAYIAIDDSQLYVGDGSNLSPVSDARHLAYVIYTSGSTGRPKGVMIEHYSVINRLVWMQKQFPITENDIILQKTPFTFDVSVWELFWWSMVGAKVVMLPQGDEKEPARIAATIEQEKINVIHFVPSMLHLFYEYLEAHSSESSFNSLRYVFTSGEALYKNHVIQFNKLIRSHASATLINLYGPTEATVDVTWYDCSRSNIGDYVPIGQPIDNTRIYIVDDTGNPVPVGQPGELCIAGDGVARGYLNLDALTAEKFVPDIVDSSSLMYRTGDLAQWMMDGNIRYLGRIDDQVKLRGYRIELGEIQSVLLQFEALKEAVVVLREDAEDRYLCAYFVAADQVTAEQIKYYLAEQLPTYMVPSYFIELDVMPLTTSGKINRSALPAIEQRANLQQLELPTSGDEKLLVALFEEVLNKAPLGMNSHFFEEGGHSLKAAKLSNSIYKVFEQHVPISVLFKNPTAAAIHQYLMLHKEEQTEKSIAKQDDRPFASPNQKRLFILDRLEKLGVTYNMPACFILEGTLDMIRMQQALQQLVDRHESLRTSFHMIDDEVEIIVHDSLELDVSVTVLTEADDVQAAFDTFVRPFDLVTGPLFRACLYKQSDTKHYLLTDIHHIVCDGISMNIFIRDLFELYKGEVLPSLTKQFKEYVHTASHYLSPTKIEQANHYWTDTFKDEVPVLHLPIDNERPPIQSHQGDYILFDINAELAVKLKETSARYGCTMNMMMLAAYFVFLHKYTGEEDIIIGSAMSERVSDEYSDVIGMFVNTVPIRVRLSGAQPFAQHLNVVRDEMLQAMDYQQFPLERIIEQVGVQRDVSRNPLFDTMFIFNQDDERGNLSALELDRVTFQPMFTKTAKFDLTFEVYASSDNEMSIRIEYASVLFAKSRVEQMADHFVSLLQRLCDEAETPLSQVDLLLQNEKSELVQRITAPLEFYLEHHTVQDWFTSHVRSRPDQIAIRFEDDTLTYKQLDERSNQLARYLRESAHVQTNELVSVMMTKSLNMVVALLGIIKAGAAYVPIDPAFPEERKTLIFQTSGSKLGLVDANSQDMSRIESNARVIPFDSISLEQYASHELDAWNGSEDLMYVIYTSGSTGVPKGVMVTHGNVLNFIVGMNQRLQSVPEDVFLSVTTISFDISVLELFWTLSNGMEIVIHSDQHSRLNFNRYIQGLRSITMMQSTPSRLKALVEDSNSSAFLSNLQVLLVGGEAFPTDLANELKLKTQARLYNMYGPTETTIWSTMHEITSLTEKAIPIGSPIVNTQVVIVDKYLQPVPDGVVGEICIGGKGVTRGYLNNELLTMERFVELKSFGHKLHVYRTGDLGRVSSDGVLHYLGRMDHQVKVNGYRIELGEIENILTQHPAVKEAAVIVRSGNGLTDDKYIAAYIVWKIEMSTWELREFLGDKLPVYMIPSVFVALQSMPQTPNGKIDRKLLPDPIIETNEEQAIQPQNEIEKCILEIWKRLFNRDDIGVTHDFFNLGGHSLMAIRLEVEMEKNGLYLDNFDIFRYRTIKDLALRVED
ncbi:amino acid adenylation domain-containing protein [Paenibacillus sp. SC116]|uniref:non-ribosomal peptide synthetase n=1 Tax=Paenibacillus sp. SC116 TaxID=2968986 RepID=UPI00215AA408|nr:non-ribosomal peptide synthetase [Paenibacillus sp. SC116]MCR8842148.1 amino acid adenylation domain-containing protein [Paenibacillus sp. SC116]